MPQDKFEGHKNIESAKVPELTFPTEKGHDLLSVLMFLVRDKSKNMPGSIWDEVGSEYRKHIMERNDEFPVVDIPEIREFLKNNLIASDIAGSEELYNLALTHGLPKEHPRAQAVYKMIEEYKPWLISDDSENKFRKVDEIRALLDGALTAAEQTFLTDKLRTERDSIDTENIIEMNEQKEYWKNDFRRLFAFFRPKQESYSFEMVSIMPPDPLSPINSGRGFVLGTEDVLKTNFNNPTNVRHEFLHGVINPIVDKLLTKLNTEQIERAKNMASRRHLEQYRESDFSVFAENLLHAFTDVFTREGDLSTVQNRGVDAHKTEKIKHMQNELVKISGDDFLKVIDQESFLSKVCVENNIKTSLELLQREDLLEKIYYGNSHSELVNVFFAQLYQDYVEKAKIDTGINFEDFVLEEVPKRL